MTNNNYPKPELLAITLRGNSVETLHYGWICILNKDKKIIFQKGNIKDSIYLRSAAKPLQAIPFVENSENINPKELSIICGSHSGSKKHLLLLRNIIKKYNLPLTELQCGIHQPLDEKERERLLTNNQKPSILHNNCSGKHLGMISTCIKNHWDLKTYLNSNHKLQQKILSEIRTLSETKNITIGIDGCSAPTFSLPIINIAKLFSNFTSSNTLSYKKIIVAMKKYPFYMGSQGQIDSELMSSSKLNLISKVGAEGIIIAAYRGTSVIVKIADGSQKIRSSIIIELLAKLGWIKKSDLFHRLPDDLIKNEVRNLTKKLIGKVELFI